MIWMMRNQRKSKNPKIKTIHLKANHSISKFQIYKNFVGIHVDLLGLLLVVSIENFSVFLSNLIEME